MATLTLLSLLCNETEDWTGADEPYLRVNGRQTWRGSLNDGDSVDFGIGQTGLDVSFSQLATIQLYDDDFGWFDNDDFLGSVQATTDQIGLGEQTAYFTGDGASYELTYIVTA